MMIADSPRILGVSPMNTPSLEEYQARLDEQVKEEERSRKLWQARQERQHAASAIADRLTKVLDYLSQADSDNIIESSAEINDLAQAIMYLNQAAY